MYLMSHLDSGTCILFTLYFYYNCACINNNNNNCMTRIECMKLLFYIGHNNILFLEKLRIKIANLQCTTTVG